MTVYVDKPVHQYRRMIMCHMLADSVDELHRMADALSLKREWFQNHGTPHYDICKSKRQEAIRLGAVEVGRKTIVELIRRHRRA